MQLEKSQPDGSDRAGGFQCPCCGSNIDQPPVPLEDPQPLQHQPSPSPLNEEPEADPLEDSLNPHPELDPADNHPPRSRTSRKKHDKKKERRLGDDELGFQPKLQGVSTWLEDCDKKSPAESVVPSAKTTAVKNQVLKWQRVAPDDKVISKLPVVHM